MGEMEDVRALHDRLVVFEATAILRHDLRNKMASVRNASFYLRRRVEKDAADLMVRDPRIATFFTLTGSELDAADVLLGERLPKLGEPAIADIDVDAVIAAALRLVGAGRASSSGVRARAVGAELTVAIACLVQNGVDAGASTVTVEAAREGARAVIRVSDDGPGIADEKVPRDGHLGVGLRIVRRVVGRAGGELALASGRGVTATISIPGASA